MPETPISNTLTNTLCNIAYDHLESIRKACWAIANNNDNIEDNNNRIDSDRIALLWIIDQLKDTTK